MVPDAAASPGRPASPNAPGTALAAILRRDGEVPARLDPGATTEPGPPLRQVADQALGKAARIAWSSARPDPAAAGSDAALPAQMLDGRKPEPAEVVRPIQMGEGGMELTPPTGAQTRDAGEVFRVTQDRAFSEDSPRIAPDVATADVVPVAATPPASAGAASEPSEVARTSDLRSLVQETGGARGIVPAAVTDAQPDMIEAPIRTASAGVAPAERLVSLPGRPASDHAAPGRAGGESRPEDQSPAMATGSELRPTVSEPRGTEVTRRVEATAPEPPKVAVSPSTVSPQPKSQATPQIQIPQGLSALAAGRTASVEGEAQPPAMPVLVRETPNRSTAPDRPSMVTGAGPVVSDRSGPALEVGSEEALASPARARSDASPQAAVAPAPATPATGPAPVATPVAAVIAPAAPPPEARFERSAPDTPETRKPSPYIANRESSSRIETATTPPGPGAEKTLATNMPSPELAGDLAPFEPASQTQRAPESAPLRGDAPHSGPRPELARSVVDQLAQAVRPGLDGGVEVQLSPEELGKVRLSLVTADGAMSVTVVAERPETLDLIRRNIEMLARDFRDQGYTSVSFSFDQQQQGHASRRGAWQADGGRPEGYATTETLAVPRAASPQTVRADGLDLRL